MEEAISNFTDQKQEQKRLHTVNGSTGLDLLGQLLVLWDMVDNYVCVCISYSKHVFFFGQGKTATFIFGMVKYVKEKPTIVLEATERQAEQL